MTIKTFLKTLDIEKLESGTIILKKRIGTKIVNIKGKRGIDIISDKEDFEIDNIIFDDEIMIVKSK